MNVAWHDAAGALGVACIVGSYLLLQLERLDARGLVYSSVNALGAGLVLVSLCFEFNGPAAAVEGFWLLISLLGIARALRRVA